MTVLTKLRTPYEQSELAFLICNSTPNDGVIFGRKILDQLSYDRKSENYETYEVQIPGASQYVLRTRRIRADETEWSDARDGTRLDE